jgi:hypothetical protein
MKLWNWIVHMAAETHVTPTEKKNEKESLFSVW